MRTKFLFYSSFVLFIAFIILFVLRGIFTLDPDFGWHLRTGEYILSHGIPQHDLYSYTMSSYPWINHEWLTDISIAIVYHAVGIVGLAIIFSIIALGALCCVFFSIPNAFRKYSYPFLMMASAVFVNFGGVRPQVITWFLFSLVILLLQKQKYIFLPFIFLVWANVHGGFISGLILLACWIVSQSCVKKKIPKKQIVFFLIIICVTCINPYSWHIYQEVWSSLSDVSLHQYISEWYPAYISFDQFLFWTTVGISIPIVFLFRKSVSNHLLFFVILSLTSITAVRNIPLWFCYTSVVISIALGKFIFSLPKENIQRADKAISFLICGLLIISSLQLFIFLMSAPQVTREKLYPVVEVTYIRTHMPLGNIFALYDWGGYLDWQLPEKKVFIDGRMPSWRMADTSQQASMYAFGDYREFLNKKSKAIQLIKKYHITMLLLPKPTATSKISPLIHFFENTHKPSTLLDFASELGFKKVYSGNVADIYVN